MGNTFSKAHKMSHQILEFLWNSWGSDLKIVNSESSAFTISEIAIALKLNRFLAEEQVAMLYHNKEIDAIQTNNGEEKFYINEKGFSTIASVKTFNEKKIVARKSKLRIKFSIFT